jgi:hypothetical protein
MDESFYIHGIFFIKPFNSIIFKRNIPQIICIHPGTILFFNMKKLLSFSVILILSILLSGCPYETAIPIDKPIINIDPKLLGTWEEMQDHDMYKVTRKDDHTYLIEITELKENKVTHNAAYPSVVNGFTFLNLWEYKDGEPEKTYSFYKIVMNDPDNLKVYPVTSNIREKFSSSSELKKFIAANMGNSYFFEPEANFIRRRN